MKSALKILIEIKINHACNNTVVILKNFQDILILIKYSIWSYRNNKPVRYIICFPKAAHYHYQSPNPNHKAAPKSIYLKKTSTHNITILLPIIINLHNRNKLHKKIHHPHINQSPNQSPLKNPQLNSKYLKLLNHAYQYCSNSKHTNIHGPSSNLLMPRPLVFLNTIKSSFNQWICQL